MQSQFCQYLFLELKKIIRKAPEPPSAQHISSAFSMPKAFRCLSVSFHLHSMSPWKTSPAPLPSPEGGSFGQLTEPACPRAVAASPSGLGGSPLHKDIATQDYSQQHPCSNPDVQKISVLFRRLASLELRGAGLQLHTNQCISWLPGVHFIKDGSTTYPETPSSLGTVAGL